MMSASEPVSAAEGDVASVSQPPSATRAVTAAAAPLDVDVRFRVLMALLFAGIEDALVAAATTMRAHSGVTAGLLAGLEVLLVLAFPLAVIAAVGSALLGSREARLLARHLRAALSRERAEDEGVATFLGTIGFAAGTSAAWRLGIRVSDFQSARVATLVSALACVGLVLGAALCAGALVPRMAPAARRVAAKLHVAPWMQLDRIAPSLVAVATLYVLLPATHAVTPSAAVVGFAVGPEMARGLGSTASVERVPLRFLLPFALALSTAASFAFGHLPDTVRMGLLARAPYGAVTVTAVRYLLDRDHDGYSAAFGGGDCDDSNRDIHPNAVDTPDDGIDQNCSGTDAHKYVPPLSPAPPTERIGSERENIVLIHLDALRADHVGLAGYRRPTTPHIDRWREGATWFSHAYTPAPSTRFALSALFTGLGVERIPQRRGHVVDFTLLPDAVTLAERLSEHGYDTVGYTLSYVLQHIEGLGQGFRVWETPWPVADWQTARDTTAEQTTNAGLKYLAGTPSDGSKPFFLFLHYDCNHDPYVRHAGWDYGSSDVDRYDSATNYCDEQVGRVLDALGARADKDKTATFVYSDHGEAFGEHGFTNHGNAVFQEDVRVLLLAKVPGAVARTIDTPMLLTDVTATIYDLAGLPADPASEGWDLVPYLDGASLPARPLFLYTDLWRSGVHFESRGVLDVDGHTKYVRDVGHAADQVYDLASDPAELANVADARPALRDHLSEMVDSWGAFENKDARSFETVNKEQKN
jgi:arylsulfatase A-like enzyme